ncbi:MAG: alkaline phosphatase family protein, partial [Archangium sp.]|nr:alkaline phosphatase family protein [Archangium sp.]
PPPPVKDVEPWGERMLLQPLLDTWVVDVALDAVKAHSLGGDEVADLLVVSFSGHDRIGHQLGPDSAKSAADYRVIDAQIGRLLRALDAQVGKGRYVVALTSDHGVMPRPELTRAQRLESGAVDPSVVLAAVKKEAEAALGPGTWFIGPKAQGLVAPAEVRAKVLGIAERLRKAARQVPGVRDLLPLPQVLAASESDPYRRGAYEGRSPDFIVVTQPYMMWGYGDATDHGSAYGYDRLVPLVFFGGALRQTRAGDARVIDLAPTMAALLGVPSPAAARGQVLDAVAR